MHAFICYMKLDTRPVVWEEMLVDYILAFTFGRLLALVRRDLLHQANPFVFHSCSKNEASMKSVTPLTWEDCPQLPCQGVLSLVDIILSGRKSPASGLHLHGAPWSKAGCRSAATLLLLFSIGT